MTTAQTPAAHVDPATPIANTVVGSEIASLYDTVANMFASATSERFWEGQLLWLSETVLVLAGAYLASGFLRWLVKRIALGKRKLDDGTIDIRYALVRAATGPVAAVVWIFALYVIARIFEVRFESKLSGWFITVRPALQIAIAGWFFLRLNRILFRDVVSVQERLSAATRDLGYKLGTAAIMLVSVVAMLPVFGVSLPGLLTVGGVGSVILGFASKDVLANYIGAIMLHFDQPFKVGDWVRLPERNVEGVVQSIGWRQVVIRNMSTELIYVPNSQFGTLTIENPGRMTHRRVKEYIGIRYKDRDRLPLVVQRFKEWIASEAEIDQSMTILVGLDRYSASSIDILVSFFTTTTEWDAYTTFRNRMLQALGEIVAQSGAEIAFPTQTIVVEKE